MSPDRVVDYPPGLRSQGPEFKSPSGRNTLLPSGGFLCLRRWRQRMTEANKEGSGEQPQRCQGIPLVPEPTATQLAEREITDYAEHQRAYIKWILNLWDDLLDEESSTKEANFACRNIARRGHSTLLSNTRSKIRLRCPRTRLGLDSILASRCWSRAVPSNTMLLPNCCSSTGTNP